MGARYGTVWEVLDGLVPGERVVIEGLQKVRNGQTVKPSEAQNQATGGGITLAETSEAPADTASVSK